MITLRKLPHLRPLSRVRERAGGGGVRAVSPLTPDPSPQNGRGERGEEHSQSGSDV